MEKSQQGEREERPQLQRPSESKDYISFFPIENWLN